MDYGNIKTPSMHRRLGSATLSQLAFPGEDNPNFPWEKSCWGNTVVKSKSKSSSRSWNVRGRRERTRSSKKGGGGE